MSMTHLTAMTSSKVNETRTEDPTDPVACSRHAFAFRGFSSLSPSVSCISERLRFMRISEVSWSGEMGYCAPEFRLSMAHLRPRCVVSKASGWLPTWCSWGSFFWAMRNERTVHRIMQGADGESHENWRSGHREEKGGKFWNHAATKYVIEASRAAGTTYDALGLFGVRSRSSAASLLDYGPALGSTKWRLKS